MSFRTRTRLVLVAGLASLALACAGSDDRHELDLLQPAHTDGLVVAPRHDGELSCSIPYHAGDLPYLLVEAETVSLRPARLVVKLEWNEPPPPGVSVHGLVDHGSYELTLPIEPGGVASRLVDLRLEPRDPAFDLYRGTISRLHVTLRGSDEVRVTRLRLVAPSWSRARRAVAESLLPPPTVQPARLLLAFGVPLVWLALVLSGRRAAALANAFLICWALSLSPTVLEAVGSGRDSLARIASEPPDTLATHREHGARLQVASALDYFAPLLPPRCRVGLFWPQAIASLPYAAGYALPLRSYSLNTPGMDYELHLVPATLPSWSVTAPAPRWTTIARGLPLAQSFEPERPLDVLALRLVVADLEPGSVLLVRLWQGAWKRRLLASAVVSPGGFARLPRAVRLTDGVDYLIELKLFASQQPVRVLAARGDPIPSGRLAGGNIPANFADMDLLFDAELVPPGYRLVAWSPTGAVLLEKVMTPR